MMSSTYFEPEGSSTGRRLYVQVWFSMYLHACKYILYHTFIYIYVNTYNTIPVFTYM